MLFCALIAGRIFLELIFLEEARIPAVSILVGRGYLQYGGFGLRGSNGLRYNTYLISARYNQRDTEATAYDARGAERKQHTAHSAKEKRDPAQAEQIRTIIPTKVKAKLKAPPQGIQIVLTL